MAVGLLFYSIGLFVGLGDGSFDTVFNAAVWPTVAVGFTFAIFLVMSAHAWLGIAHQVQDYLAVTLVAFVSRSVAGPNLCLQGP